MSLLSANQHSLDSDEFSLVQVTHRDVEIIEVHGACDIWTAPRLSELLSAELARPAARLLLDLGSATVFDSTSLGVVVQAFKLADPKRHELVVAARGTVRLAFEVAGLDRILPLFETRAEALDMMQASDG